MLRHPDPRPVAGVRARHRDGPRRTGPDPVPGLASARGSGPQRHPAGAADARPASQGPAQGRGVPRRGRHGRRARHRAGGVGRAPGDRLDPGPAARRADRPQQHLAGRVHRGAGRQPRGRPDLRDPRVCRRRTWSNCSAGTPACPRPTRGGRPSSWPGRSGGWSRRCRLEPKVPATGPVHLRRGGRPHRAPARAGACSCGSTGDARTSAGITAGTPGSSRPARSSAMSTPPWCSPVCSRVRA